MSVLSNLEKGLVGLSDVSYNSIDKLMRKLAKDHEITPRELHDKFKAKHDMIPDDWIKKQMKINEEGLRDWFGKSKSKDGKPGWVQSDGSPCANEPGEKGTPKCYSSAKKASMSKKELRSADTRKSRQDPGQQQKSGAAKPTYVSTDKPKKKMKEETILEKDMLDKQGNDKFDRHKRMIRHKQDKYGRASVMDKIKTGKDYKEETFNEAEDKKTKGSGTKDACYTKVKSRYSVWPSAYASGALVKCRKVGAANWGNSTKKEEFEGFYDLPAFTESQIAAMKYAGIEVEVIDEACWKGYEKKGMKTMFGKRYPNCVKKEETEVEEGVLDAALEADKKVGQLHKKVDNDVKRMKAGKKFKEEVTGGILVQDAGDFKPREIESVDIIKADPIKGGQLQELVRTKIQTGNMYQVIFGWRGKMMMVKLFFPDASIPNRQKVADALNKMYPGSQLRSYSHSVVDYDDPYINVGEETILEKKEEEKYCRLCEKRETRGTCGYGPKMFDKFSVDDVSDSVKSSAAAESDITEDINKEVEDRMQSDENRKRSLIRSKMRASRSKQKSDLQSEENIEEDMTGMSQKSGDKRSTDSGAGMTAKGVAKYNRRTGGNLKTAVTTPPSKLKPGSKAAGRRKSFCARSKSWKGERGLAARRRWNC